jgi:quinol monooxygenase YgiN
MGQNVYWVLEVNVNPGKLDDGQALMDEMVNGTFDNESGALNYEWNFNEDRTSMHIYERYADSAATMVHLGNFGSKYAERFLQYFAPAGFTVYGEVSDEVKAALAGFGPVYYTPAAGFARQ